LSQVEAVIERARTQAGKGTVYRLGGGNPDAGAFSCQDGEGECDCSAFMQWLLGIPRYMPQLAWLKRVNGGWYNTDGIWWDATRERTGLFEESIPLRGALIVYPSNWVAKVDGPRVGHIGLVTEATNGRAVKVIHCSAGNFRKHGDAIHETGPEVWDAVESSKCAWFSGVEKPDARGVIA